MDAEYIHRTSDSCCTLHGIRFVHIESIACTRVHKCAAICGVIANPCGFASKRESIVRNHMRNIYTI